MKDRSDAVVANETFQDPRPPSGVEKIALTTLTAIATLLRMIVAAVREGDVEQVADATKVPRSAIEMMLDRVDKELWHDFVFFWVL